MKNLLNLCNDSVIVVALKGDPMNLPLHRSKKQSFQWSCCMSLSSLHI